MASTLHEINLSCTIQQDLEKGLGFMIVSAAEIRLNHKHREREARGHLLILSVNHHLLRLLLHSDVLSSVEALERRIDLEELEFQRGINSQRRRAPGKFYLTESKQDIMCSVYLGKDVIEKHSIISILAQKEDAFSASQIRDRSETRVGRVAVGHASSACGARHEPALGHERARRLQSLTHKCRIRDLHYHLPASSSFQAAEELSDVCVCSVFEGDMSKSQHPYRTIVVMFVFKTECEMNETHWFDLSLVSEGETRLTGQYRVGAKRSEDKLKEAEKRSDILLSFLSQRDRQKARRDPSVCLTVCRTCFWLKQSAAVCRCDPQIIWGRTRWNHGKSQTVTEIHTVKHEITASSADPAVCDSHQKSESGVQARLRDVCVGLQSGLCCPAEVQMAAPLSVAGLVSSAIIRTNLRQWEQKVRYKSTRTSRLENWVHVNAASAHHSIIYVTFALHNEMNVSLWRGMNPPGDLQRIFSASGIIQAASHDVMGEAADLCLVFSWVLL
ncbi:hypothetical protein QQF64_003283 [Cirrhinus molitorella]|uniref:Uncharacterized protein n=1 Tax=Cirrhinus molitorella TaxID=172907 RepID=A0ABR3MKL6_9TELE